MRLALLVVVTLTTACGARTRLDESAEAPLIAGDETGCGFEVEGALRASVEGSPTVCSCGTEIPFIRFTCTGSVAGVTYSFAGDYIPAMFEGVALTAGATTFSSYTPTPCTATVLLDGVAPKEGSPYEVGEPFSMSFACPSLTSDDAGTVELKGGRLSTVISKL
jgi:hypothetical protein